MSIPLTADKFSMPGLSPRLTGIKEIAGYSHYLMMKGQLAGSLTLDGHDVSDAERSIAGKCRLLSDEIRRQLCKCRVEDMAVLLDCYDLVYRMGYGTMPDMDYIDSRKLHILASWKAGNRRINGSVIFGILSSYVRFDIKGMEPVYVDAYRSMKDEWLATLMKYNRFPKATAYENFQRLSLVMREDLGDYCEDETAAKYKWYCHNKIDNMSTIGSQLLRSYRRFASSLFPDVLSHEDQLVLDNSILTELSTRIDLDPYEREAFQMAREYIGNFCI